MDHWKSNEITKKKQEKANDVMENWNKIKENIIGCHQNGHNDLKGENENWRKL